MNDARRDLIGKTVRVGSGGFVRLVDFMGSDEDIVETARVSTGRGFVSWETYRRCRKCALIAGREGFQNVPPDIMTLDCEHDWQEFARGDEGILDYMIANRHTSPFEFGEIKLHVRVPMDSWRQWIRHRTANVAEYSTRYSPAIDEAAVTAPDKWRTQGTSNRQGSGAYLPERDEQGDRLGEYLTDRERKLHRFAREVYEERLSFGVAREQARKDLPLSTYTEAYWKVDLHNLMHFLGLRCHPHAQIEIREYADVIKDEFAALLWPRTIAIFEERELHGARLSRTDVQFLGRLLVACADNPQITASIGDDPQFIALKKRFLP